MATFGSAGLAGTAAMVEEELQLLDKFWMEVEMPESEHQITEEERLHEELRRLFDSFRSRLSEERLSLLRLLADVSASIRTLSIQLGEPLEDIEIPDYQKMMVETPTGSRCLASDLESLCAIKDVLEKKVQERKEQLEEIMSAILYLRKTIGLLDDEEEPAELDLLSSFSDIHLDHDLQGFVEVDVSLVNLQRRQKERQDLEERKDEEERKIKRLKQQLLWAWTVMTQQAPDPWNDFLRDQNTSIASFLVPADLLTTARHMMAQLDLLQQRISECRAALSHSIPQIIRLWEALAASHSHRQNLWSRLLSHCASPSLPREIPSDPTAISSLSSLLSSLLESPPWASGDPWDTTLRFSPETIELCARELGRLRQIHQQQMLRLLASEMKEVNELWDTLHFSNGQRQRFLAHLLHLFDTDPDNLSSLKEAIAQEIRSLRGLLESMKEIISMIERREWFKSEMQKFEASACDPSRLSGSSYRLIQEEKFRRLVSKEYPRLTRELKEHLEAWCEAHGHDLLYKNESYLSIMEREQENPQWELLHLRLLTSDPTTSSSHRSSSSSSLSSSPVSSKSSSSISKTNTRSKPTTFGSSALSPPPAAKKRASVPVHSPVPSKPRTSNGLLSPPRQPPSQTRSTLPSQQ